MPDDDANNGPDDAALPRGIGRPLALTIVVGALILIAQLYPFDFRFDRTGDWLALTRADPLGLLGNVLLFVPLGLAEYALAYRLFGPRGWLVLIVAIDAALLALVGESAQCWLPTRDSAVIDLVANMMGGAIGAVAAARAVQDEPPADGDRT